MSNQTPPPFPAEDGATQFVSAMAAPPPFPSGPSVPLPPLDPPAESTHTNTRFAVPVASDSGTDVGPAGRQRRLTADARIRQPAPAEHQPALLPNAAAARQVRSPLTIRPGVVNPVHARDTAERGFGDNSRESSDIISSFQRSGGSGAPQPRPLTAEGLRRPQRPGRQPATGEAKRQPAGRGTVGRHKPRRQTYNPPPRQEPPPTLPLNQEHVGLLIADQRRRLHVLYGYARGLEIGAGVLGTLSLAVLIAAMVSILLGTKASVVATAGALVGSSTGLAMTLTMVTGAVAIRQVAHTSAQLAALIEALCHRSPN